MAGNSDASPEPAAAAHAQDPAPSVSLPTLFFACLRIGLFSFGGGLSGWVYQEFVVTRGWISEDDFASSLAVGQMLPGGNVANLVVCLGEELRGLLGAITAVFGLLVGPFFAVIALSVVIGHIPDSTTLDIALGGAASAAIGMLLILCWRGIRRAAERPAMLGIILVVALGVGVFNLPLLLVALVVSPVSVALAWRRATANA